ncbi:hypothetical protein CVT26_000741, partial [Gymnopilus dilepis]
MFVTFALQQPQFSYAIPSAVMSTRQTVKSHKLARNSVVRFTVPYDTPSPPTSAPRHERQAVMENPWLPPDDLEMGLDVDTTQCEKALASDYVDLTQELARKLAEEKKKKKKKRSLASSRPMLLWKKSFRDIYLGELLRSEGRGDVWDKGDTKCFDCRARKSEQPNVGVFRCRDCFIPHLTCKDCCVRRHRMLPFHNIEQWTGSTFIKSSLKKLGLRIQLNHTGMACSKPEACHSKFVILHTNGIHQVNVDYCGCRPVPKIRQLLRRGLYPASQENPRTCATFSLLDHMHMLSLTSKCSTYDYYKALEKLTNNTGINLPHSKYRPLSRMLLQWRHLKMLKRAGRGHDRNGIAGTKDGELAVLCPSCPHPGINLPDKWQEASASERFLYAVILCMDANFRLKNQLVSNYSVDPGLGRGWSYTVSREPFEEYVRSRINDVDVDGDESKGCGLQAVEQANTKYNKGLRYTGVTAVSCGRSEMVMPCSVGNLHKGEKYANMDFGFASTLRFFIGLMLIIVSYDAACQWFVKYAKRVRDYWPKGLKPPPTQTFLAVIPKMHEEGHKKTKNHEQFSFNLTPGVGHTDGECPERIW